MHNMSKLSFCLAVAASLASAISTGAQQSTEELMPAGFGSVYPGMTHDELLAVRPQTESFDLFGEPEESNEHGIDLYLEPELDSPFFDQVMYTFVGVKLCIVRFLGTGDKVDSKVERARVIRGSVRKWGDGFSRILYAAPDIPELEGISAAGPVPGLHWILDGVEILLRYSGRAAQTHKGKSSPAGKTADLPHVDLVIFQRDCLTIPELTRWLEGVTQPDAEIENGLFEELSLEVSPPWFE